MQHEQRLPLAGLQNFFVQVRLLPCRELFGLVLRQAGFHGEIGSRQVQCFLEFEWFGHELSERKSPFVLALTVRLLAILVLAVSQFGDINAVRRMYTAHLLRRLVVRAGNIGKHRETRMLQ